MAEVSVGVVGFGYWGANHVRGLYGRAGITVTVVDPDPGRRAVALQAFPGIATAANLDEVSHLLDAAVICTPPATHHDLGVAAMTAGAHVLIEKPMATSARECAELIDVARICRRVLMVGHTYDYHAVVDQLAERVSVGELGAIRYLDSARLSVGGYRRDVNVMWDMAPHDIVIMRRVLNSWPNRVAAWSMDHAGEGVGDRAMIRLDFDRLNTVGYIKVSWLDPIKVRSLSIVGSEKMAVFDELRPSERPLRLVHSGNESRLGEGSQHPLPAGYGAELITEPLIPQWEPLARQLDHFLRCIQTGATPRTHGLEGLRVVEILEAADRSVETGQAVDVHAYEEIMLVS